nr:unnamed protein product [Callosobruchus analis]
MTCKPACDSYSGYYGKHMRLEKMCILLNTLSGTEVSMPKDLAR